MTDQRLDVVIELVHTKMLPAPRTGAMQSRVSRGRRHCGEDPSTAILLEWFGTPRDRRGPIVRWRRLGVPQAKASVSCALTAANHLLPC